MHAVVTVNCIFVLDEHVEACVYVCVFVCVDVCVYICMYVVVQVHCIFVFRLAFSP